MKAAVLKAFGSPLSVETLPDPELGTGEVIVDIVATSVINYSNEVFSGQRKYLLDLPVAPGPGGIGRVRAFGPDATHLELGNWVYCDPTVRSRDDVQLPDMILQGWTALAAGGLRLQKHFRHGSWAERTLVPTENAIRLGELDVAEAPSWCKIGSFLVPYGGLLAARVQAGETVLINGATGNFGSAGVAVALAMGAGSVIATGRNEATLAELVRRFGPRVRTVRMSGDEENDRKAMRQTAGRPIDCVLDILPPAASPVSARAAIMAVRPYGRVVLMGGVGLQGGGVLELPYAWIMRNCVTIIGQWMYPPEAVARMVDLIRSGLINLDRYDIALFDLDNVNEAVAHAAAHAGPFEATVLQP
jgi:alcohol dehydrogenase